MPLSFTILLPVHRNADLIPYAIESVLWQTNKDFELFIICDGAPADTIDCANQFAKKDERIRVFSFPKGARHGEDHRHVVLQHAGGRFIAYICDDDLWFPNHLEEMTKLLQQADFGNLIFSFVDPDHDNKVFVWSGSLEDEVIIEKMVNLQFNFFGPTAAGHTMSAYQKLSQGWSPAPPNIPTDLFMWRKFLVTPGLKFGTRMSVTSCHFATSSRKHFSDSDRKTEMRMWFKKIQCADERDQIVQQILKKWNSDAIQLDELQKKYYTLNKECDVLHKKNTTLINSHSWRVTRPLRECRSWLSRFMNPKRSDY